MHNPLNPQDCLRKDTLLLSFTGKTPEYLEVTWLAQIKSGFRPRQAGYRVCELPSLPLHHRSSIFLRPQRTRDK